METTLDNSFIKSSEGIVSQFGFNDLKSFIKNQTLLLLLAKIEAFWGEQWIYFKYFIPGSSHNGYFDLILSISVIDFILYTFCIYNSFFFLRFL
ncbi:MAG: hypothetical protein HQK65_08005 [Desulfamplus sp.]|nr:hypothetical protein [Desulfamplus sp.]